MTPARVLPCVTCGALRTVRRGLYPAKDCKVCHNEKQRRLMRALFRHSRKWVGEARVEK